MSPSSPTAEDSLPVSAAFNASTQCSPLSVPVPVSNFMIANNSSAPTTVSAGEAELFLSTIRDSSRERILKRIPRAYRHLAASKLASILDDVTEKNDFPSWDRLFAFSSRCFAASKRGGQRRSLAAAVNKQLRDELAPASQGQPLHHNPGSKSRSSPDPLTSLAKRVSSKLEDGDYKGAVRLACSEDSFATIDTDVLSTLKEKHSSAHPDTCFPSVPELSEAFAHITEKEVAMSIKSFPSGSSGGPDGLRPQHLKDLTSESAERGGRELLSSLTSFINHILEGNAPHSMCPILFGATVIALRKKEGGIRPIAIGFTLRRLAAKIGGYAWFSLLVQL